MKLSGALLLSAFISHVISPSPAVAAACFRKPQVYPTGQYPLSLVTGDLNNDGRPDFVVSYDSYNFDYCNDRLGDEFINNGKGGFSHLTRIDTGAAPVAMQLADFNRDGIPDLAVATAGCPVALPPGLYVALGKGDGTFIPGSVHASAKFPSGLAAADFNGDGIVDLLMDNSEGGHKLHLGKGDGTFQPPTQVPGVQGWVYNSGVIAADFNRDGKIDIAFIGNTGSSFTVQLGNGDGTFNDGPIYVGTNIATGDLNQDGILDIVAVDFYPSIQIDVLTGNGDGTFTLAQTYPDSSGIEAAIGDLNNDGSIDFVVSDDVTPGDIKIFNGMTNGAFVERSVPMPGGTRPIALVDLDGDGYLDVIAAEYDHVVVLRNTGQCH